MKGTVRLSHGRDMGRHNYSWLELNLTAKDEAGQPAPFALGRWHVVCWFEAIVCMRNGAVPQSLILTSAQMRPAATFVIMFCWAEYSTGEPMTSGRRCSCFVSPPGSS